MTDIATDTLPAKELKIPLALLAAGLGLCAVYLLTHVGVRGLGGGMAYLAIWLVIKTVLGVIGCLLAARLMGCGYGALFTGILKLAAIFVLPGAVGLFISSWILAAIVELILYWGLIEWLFELDPLETVVTVIVIWVVNAFGFLVAAAAIATVV